MTSCEHPLVIPFEPPPRSGPVLVRWHCDECFAEFEPVRSKPPSAIKVWRETRALKRAVEGWRNG